MEVIRRRRGADPDFIVRLPDGRHAAVAMSWTNYAGTTEPLAALAPGLLTLAGLRQLVQWLDHWRQERQYDEGSST